MTRFSYTRKGIRSSFSPEERRLLQGVVPLLESVGEGEDDPAAQRLSVPVYLDDPSANDEWWRLMGSELADARTSDRGVFEAMVANESSTLTEEEALAVLRVINETRLVLGARLGIDVEEDHDRVPVESRAALDYLGWIQEELTDALSRFL
jgi:hypothetical protein